MTAHSPDDDLRRRLQELGRSEAGNAPHFARVLRGSRPAPEGGRARSGVAGLLRPAAALAFAFLVAAVAWWWPTRAPTRTQHGEPIVRHAESWSSGPTQQWGLPSDGLLAGTEDGAGDREVEELSREIEGLLQP
jgi:hypothetical protein